MSELFMVCEEEELEPWQRMVPEINLADDNEEDDEPIFVGEISGTKTTANTSPSSESTVKGTQPPFLSPVMMARGSGQTMQNPPKSLPAPDEMVTSSTHTDSLWIRYTNGASDAVVPAGTAGLISEAQAQSLLDSVVMLANPQAPQPPKQPAMLLGSAQTQSSHVPSSALRSQRAIPLKPQTKQVACESGSAGQEVTSTAKRTKLQPGVPSHMQNRTPFREKCPRCDVQFNLPDPMKRHMRTCCFHLISTIFPSVSTETPPTPSLSVLDAKRGKLVMLVTEFYYGRHEGDKTPACEQKTNVTFRCTSCLKVLKSNIRFMNHMKHHLELEKQGDESWESHTTCQHCNRQYATPFALQCHTDSAHSHHQFTTNCKICELAFETEEVLLKHMKDNHKPGEMPYVCQVCNYRSSFFWEVESHFRQTHENTKDLQCPFCLKVLKSGHMYMQHYMRHQKKRVHRCGKCRLNFLTTKEKMVHTTNFHQTLKKPKKLEGLCLGTKVTIRASAFGGLSDSTGSTCRVGVLPSNTAAKSRHSTQSGRAGRTKPSPNQKQELPSRSIVQDRCNAALKSMKKPSWLKQTCVECSTVVDDLYTHFPMVLSCGACHYRTSCRKSFANHMIWLHSAISKDRFQKMKRPRGIPRGITLVCQDCDFTASASSTDFMCNHLIDQPGHRCKVIDRQSFYASLQARTEGVAPEPNHRTAEATPVG